MKQLFLAFTLIAALTTLAVAYGIAGVTPDQEEAQPPVLQLTDLGVAPQETPVIAPTPEIPKLTAGPVDYLNRPSTLKGLEDLYKAAQGTYGALGQHQEYSTTLDPTGTLRGITTSHTADRNVVQFPHGDMAIVHTHPQGTHPEPSAGDFAAANKSGQPNFEISGDAVWVAMPGNTKPVKVADIKLQHGKPVFNWVKETQR